MNNEKLNSTPKLSIAKREIFRICKDRIVKPRIPDRVCVDHDRLELRHDLGFSIAMRQPRLKPDRSTC